MTWLSDKLVIGSVQHEWYTKLVRMSLIARHDKAEWLTLVRCAMKNQRR